MKQITVNFSCFLRCAVSVQCFPVPYTEPYPAIVLIYTIFLSQSKNREPLQIVVELNFKKLPRYLLRFLCLLKTANSSEFCWDFEILDGNSCSIQVQYRQRIKGIMNFFKTHTHTSPEKIYVVYLFGLWVLMTTRCGKNRMRKTLSGPRKVNNFKYSFQNFSKMKVFVSTRRDSVLILN